MIRIGIVDDHALFRTGLRQFLGEQVDLRVTGEAASCREAITLAAGDALDVMLLDLSLPDGSGVDVLASIRARRPALPLLVLSAFPEQQYATTMLRQGASGYLSKDCEPEEVAKAIRTLALGRRYVSAGVADMLAGDLAGARERCAHELLSERELCVYLRLAKGETVGRVARGMSLSVKTISTYRTRVLHKLGLATNSELTYHALKNGLIQ